MVINGEFEFVASEIFTHGIPLWLSSIKSSIGRGDAPLFIVQIDCNIELSQPCGISRFSLSFHIIAPPLDLYGLPSSFGKSNCTNQ